MMATAAATETRARLGIDASPPDAGGAALRDLPACPWCGGTGQLELRGDGMGQVAVGCGGCGATGPRASIAGDFSSSDDRATALWSGRRIPHPAPRDTVNRVGMAVRLHCLTGRLTPEATIGVAWSDLDTLLRSVSVTDAKPAAGSVSDQDGTR